MKCCKCGKEIDTTRMATPPEWYAVVEAWAIRKVICRECYKSAGPDWNED